MIFVTVGTTDFDSLVEAMDELAGGIDEKVVIQIGRGRYQPRNCEYFRFTASLDEYYDQARIVVGHGGLGTVIEILERRKKLISISNPDRYDLHQEDLLAAMEERNHIVWCRSLDGLADALRRIEQVDLTPYTTPECTIAEEITRFLTR